MNENIQSNLVGELVGEMQRNNPPHIFNVDNNGNASGSSQGQFQSGMTHPTQSVANDNVQINPQLQQQFLIVLQHNPQLMQMFQNAQTLDQALKNPQIMLSAITQHQQMQAQMQT